MGSANEPLTIGVVCPNRDHREVSSLFGRSSKVSGDVEVEVPSILQQRSSRIPLDFRILDQTLIIRGNAKHQLLKECGQMPGFQCQLVLFLNVLIGEPVFPSPDELGLGTGEPFAYWPDVDIPSPGLNGRNQGYCL